MNYKLEPTKQTKWKERTHTFFALLPYIFFIIVLRLCETAVSSLDESCETLRQSACSPNIRTFPGNFTCRFHTRKKTKLLPIAFWLKVKFDKFWANINYVTLLFPPDDLFPILGTKANNERNTNPENQMRKEEEDLKSYFVGSETKEFWNKICIFLQITQAAGVPFVLSSEIPSSYTSHFFYISSPFNLAVGFSVMYIFILASKFRPTC